MVPMVKFSAGARCIRSLTPDLENQLSPDLKVSCDPSLDPIEILQCQEVQSYRQTVTRLRSVRT